MASNKRRRIPVNKVFEHLKLKGFSSFKIALGHTGRVYARAVNRRLPPEKQVVIFELDKKTQTVSDTDVMAVLVLLNW